MKKSKAKKVSFISFDKVKITIACGEARVIQETVKKQQKWHIYI